MISNPSTIVIKRDQWVLDENAFQCFSCEKKFNPLYRRKHHCKNCGNIFCSKCSDNFLDGSYFQFVEKKEKNVRFCDKCFTQILEILESQGALENQSLSKIKQWNKCKEQLLIKRKKHEKRKQQQQKIQSTCGSLYESHIVSKNQEQSIQNGQLTISQTLQPQRVISLENEMAFEQSCSSDKKKVNSSKQEVFRKTSSIHIQRIQSFEYGEECTEQQLKEDLTIFLNEKLDDLIFENIQFYQLDNWLSLILKFVKKSINDIQISTFKSPSIDINDYIQIKKILHVDRNQSKYIQGIISRKSVSLKKMMTKLINPLILVIEGSFDLELQKDLSFDQLIKNEPKFIQKTKEIIEKIKPNILFVEKNVNNQILSILFSMNISVVQTVKVI